MSLLPSQSDEEYALEARCKMACRKWAEARAGILPIIRQSPVLDEFDRAMFALGEIVWRSEGGVEEVKRGEKEVP
jgi:hypothetical protein